MEMKENDKYKTWRMNPDSDSSWPTDGEASSGKKFTIPKIRRTTEKGKISIQDESFYLFIFLKDVSRIHFCSFLLCIKLG